MAGPRDPTICSACYWASPESYAHVATEEARRLDLVWKGHDKTGAYDRLHDRATKEGIELPEYVKDVLDRHTQPEV